MSKNAYPLLGALYPHITVVAGTISVGASGAVSVSDAKGVSSVERISAGHYAVKFDRPYAKCLFAGGNVTASGVDYASISITDIANVSDATTPQLTVHTTSGTNLVDMDNRSFQFIALMR